MTKRSFVIENDDRLKAIFVVMRIEQPQLLVAMNRIEGIVDVEHDPFGNWWKGLQQDLTDGAAHAQQRASVG